MANKSLFKSIAGGMLPRANTTNEAGGAAYALPPKQALAQYAATGCMTSTYYASAEVQLATILDLCSKVEPEFIARAAVYCRKHGNMKDVPALLCAVLAVRSPGLLAEVFDRVIDNGKMLRNFVQIIRSGVVGRKSLGSLPKRLVQQWLESRSDDAVFRASVGNDPSLADIIKMVHPKPATPARAALYGYLLGREFEKDNLPELVRYYESFKAGHVQLRDAEAPDVPMDMLTSLPLKPRHWAAIARNASWQTARMNLNTFARQGAFEVPGVAEAVAKKLTDPAEVARARVFPYQLMVAYTTISDAVPQVCREALQDAMELAIRNVPEISGKVWIFPDVSGSMQSPVTGHRKGSTTAVRCLDVAALVAAAVLRKNPSAGVVPFSDDVVTARLNPRDSVMTNAKVLASLPSGGTNCSAPLAYLNRQHAEGDLVIFVSDNESWVDSLAHGRFGGSATRTMSEWASFKKRNPRAKMVCIDIQPYGTTQAAEREDILNIGGFSDTVFDVVSKFSAGSLTPEHWVGVIESVQL
jgi:60 kDa SS-A/Ro ribonucleoprotein